MKKTEIPEKEETARQERAPGKERTARKERAPGRSKALGGTDSILREWVSRLVRNTRAAHWAFERLSPILAHDQSRGTDLAATLRTYLDCDRSKQRTASRLYVHRQTLYHRLGQIKRLLQADLDDPLQRILLHAYLHHSAKIDSARIDSARIDSRNPGL